MPPALALVNPNRSDDSSGLGHLAAAGVTFVLLVALRREARLQGLGEGPDLLKLLDLAALGTICDVVPLKGLNRALVSQGLKVMSHSQMAYAYASELDRVNHDRKLLQAHMLEEALTKAASLSDERALTLVSMQGWHPGVIGIVAGRLKDRFDLPAIVIGINEEGIGKGSGRSLKGVNLGAAITAAREAGLLLSGGGHPMAGGLTVDADLIPNVSGGHVRCAFADNSGQRVAGICFRADETGLSDVLLSPNPARVHVAGRLREDIWNGRVRIDLNVEDLALA